MFKSNFLII